MASTIAQKQGEPMINSREKDTMQRIVLCLSARVQALSALSAIDGITSADMKLLEPVFEVLFTGREPDVFPIEPHKFSHAQPVKPSTEGEIIEAALKSVSGTVVCLRIEKIGLKDAQEYIDPFITILVADSKTNLLDTHDTPVAQERRPTHVVFN